MKEFLVPVRVYIEDTDAGGIVYYINYLKYMERARTELLRSLGFDKRFIFNRDLMFVVHSLQVDYIESATLDDELTVSARVIKSGRASLLFEQSVRRAEKILCQAEIKIACVGKESRKPRSIPPEILDRLNHQVNNIA